MHAVECPRAGNLPHCPHNGAPPTEPALVVVLRVVVTRVEVVRGVVVTTLVVLEIVVGDTDLVVVVVEVINRVVVEVTTLVVEGTAEVVGFAPPNSKIALLTGSYQHSANLAVPLSVMCTPSLKSAATKPV